MPQINGDENGQAPPDVPSGGKQEDGRLQNGSVAESMPEALPDGGRQAEFDNDEIQSANGWTRFGVRAAVLLAGILIAA